MNYLQKALRRFTTFLLIKNNFWGKLVSSSELPIIFCDNLKTASVLFFITGFLFFIAGFNLLSCEFDSFTFKLLY